jgi:hypothetical protein
LLCCEPSGAKSFAKTNGDGTFRLKTIGFSMPFDWYVLNGFLVLGFLKNWSLGFLKDAFHSATIQNGDSQGYSGDSILPHCQDDQ